MVARGFLDVKVAVPCDANRKPIPADGIFHEKAGVIEDRGGDKIAWNGSLNETAAGWRHNWESINVYTSWGLEPKRVVDEEANFARIWANRAQRVIVLDVPDAVRQNLMRFMPASDMPSRLKEPEKKLPKSSTEKPKPDVIEPAKPVALQTGNLRSRVWDLLACLSVSSCKPKSEQYARSSLPFDPWQSQSGDRVSHHG